MDLKELKRLAGALDDSSKREFIYFLQSRTSMTEAPIHAINEIHEQEHKEGLICPHCESRFVVRFGKFDVETRAGVVKRQRYRCKACLKTFNDLTNTPLQRTKRLHLWVRFIECMIEGLSLRKCAERLQYYLPLTWQMYHQRLFRNITYPIKNKNGDYKTTFNDITVAIFNFIEGETLAEAYPFSKEILENIAKSVAEIQLITPFIDKTTLLTETFDISFESDLEKCISMLESTVTFNNPIKQALQEHVLPKKEQVFILLNLVRKLRGVAIADTKEKVLCHGDIWGGNLIRHDNELYFVDWESAIIAPPEFDLVGYIGEEFDVFFSTYETHIGHSVKINLDLLRFYSYRHHLRNLTNWLMNILYRNTEEAQNENDLEMIIYHCLNRWDSIEPKVRAVDAILQKRK